MPPARARKGETSAELGFDAEELEQLEPSREPPRPPPQEEPSGRALDLATIERQVQVIQRRAELLRVATIALTLPTDWVRMGDFFYLQNKGCERVVKAWGIEVFRVQPTDFERDELPGGHVSWSVILAGRSMRTGESKSEIGARSTVSEFYRSRFEAAGQPERLLLIYDCKKSALTNANGRLTRALTGMTGMPASTLQAAGFNVEAIPSAEFVKGGKGGALSADAASDKQLWKIAALACKDRRVQDLEPKDLDATKEMLRGCRLTGGRNGTASRVIEWLEKQRQPVPMDQFLAEVGHRDDTAPDGSAAGSAAEGSPS